MRLLAHRRLLQWGMIALAYSAAFSAIQAQEETAPVSASIHISKPLPYERESVILTLTIKTVGVQFRKQIDLINLPDKKQFDIFSDFETLPTKRVGNGHRITEIHRYRCRGRALKPGQIRIAPTLRLVVMRRRRMLIGSAWEEFPHQIKISPVILNVKALPSPPPTFSGAIGNFKFSAGIVPSDIVVGDLVTLTTRLSGTGYRENLHIPKLSSSTDCKVYDPHQTQTSPNLLIHEQVVIPQSADVAQIPPVSVTFFNTISGRYETITKGPFPITYHTATATELDHFRPTDNPGTTNASTKALETNANKRMRFRSQLDNVRYKKATCPNATAAHISPSIRSLATFDIEAKTEVHILKYYNDWLLIESDNRRGWITEEAIQK